MTKQHLCVPTPRSRSVPPVALRRPAPAPRRMSAPSNARPHAATPPPAPRRLPVLGLPAHRVSRQPARVRGVVGAAPQQPGSHDEGWDEGAGGAVGRPAGPKRR